MSCNNPLLSAEQAQLFCGQFGLSTAPDSTDTASVTLGKRNVEGGGRQSDITHESFRTVLGLRGDINDTWSYDAYGQYGETQLALTFLNDFSIQRTSRAVDVQIDRRVNANGTPVNAATFGTPQCVAFLDGTDPACVPYNPWQPGAITQDQLNYLQIPLVQRGTTTERVVNASFTGDLANYGVKLPTAQSGLLVNVGVEWREEKSELLPDAAFQSGDGAGQGGPTPPISGGYIAKDIFAEARMALIEDRAVRAERVGRGGLSLLRLQPRLLDRHLQARSRVDAGRGHPRAGELSARGARAERRRAVRCANGRPRRHDRRVRRSGADADVRAVRAYRRDGRAVRQHRGESGRAVQRLRRRQSGPAAGDGGHDLVRPRVPAELRCPACACRSTTSTSRSRTRSRRRMPTSRC